MTRAMISTRSGRRMAARSFLRRIATVITKSSCWMYPARSRTSRTNRPGQLTNNEQSDVLPRWQPNGKCVVYVSDVNGQWDIYAINVTSGLVRQLTERRSRRARPAGPAGRDEHPADPGIGSPTPFPTQAPQVDGVVNSGRLNVRANPGEGASILTVLSQGNTVDIIGRYCRQ